MAPAGRGGLRPYQPSKFQPFIIICLLVTVVIIGFNFWNLMKKNAVLLAEIGKVQGHLGSERKDCSRQLAEVEEKRKQHEAADREKEIILEDTRRIVEDLKSEAEILRQNITKLLSHIANVGSMKDNQSRSECLQKLEESRLQHESSCAEEKAKVQVEMNDQLNVMKKQLKLQYQETQHLDQMLQQQKQQQADTREQQPQGHASSIDKRQQQLQEQQSGRVPQTQQEQQKQQQQNQQQQGQQQEQNPSIQQQQLEQRQQKPPRMLNQQHQRGQKNRNFSYGKSRTRFLKKLNRTHSQPEDTGQTSQIENSRLKAEPQGSIVTFRQGSELETKPADKEQQSSDHDVAPKEGEDKKALANEQQGADNQERLLQSDKKQNSGQVHEEEQKSSSDPPQRDTRPTDINKAKELQNDNQGRISMEKPVLQRAEYSDPSNDRLRSRGNEGQGDEGQGEGQDDGFKAQGLNENGSREGSTVIVQNNSNQNVKENNVDQDHQQDDRQHEHRVDDSVRHP